MKTKQGISLIVLVITIIVMVILAGAIVLTLNNSGIIDKASEAVDNTNYATIKELTQMAWAEAYANGAKTQQEFQDAVDKALEDNKVDTDKYGIIVTTNGVEVANGWIQDGLTVKRGKTVLEIGDNIEYIATGTNYNGEWKVLGTSEKGELLIVTFNDFWSNGLAVSSSDFNESQKLWLNFTQKLDEICKPLGQGRGATGARSITLQDIDKVTGFDKTTYGKGKINEYGNEVTYKYNETTSRWDYTSTNSSKGTLSATHNNGFHYYDGNKFGVSTSTVKLKSDFYMYGQEDLQLTEKASLMIFGSPHENLLYDAYYWLADSSYISADYSMIPSMGGKAEFGLRYISAEKIYSVPVWFSDGAMYGDGAYVRAVVSLAPDIQVIGSSEAGWTY